MTHLKFVDGSDTAIEGLLMPFGGFLAGGPKGKDLYNEYFSDNTDFVLSWHKSGGWPLLYNHGLDVDSGVTPVGVITSIDVKAELGGWMQAQLDSQSEYFDSIRKLIADKKLYLSSGAMSHLVQVDKKSGEILRWPVVEGSLTPTPANLLASVDFATAKSHFKSAGLTLHDAELEALRDSPAVVDESERSYEDIRSDIQELLNPTNMFGPSAYTYIVATYPNYVIACRCEYDDDSYDDDCTYWKIEYTLDDDQEPVLGTVTQVESAYIPVAKSAPVSSLLIPLSSDVHSTTLRAEALVQRTKDLHQRRIKEGRVLSSANRKLLHESAETLEAATKALRDLLDATDPEPDDSAAKAAAAGKLAALTARLALEKLYLDTI